MCGIFGFIGKGACDLTTINQLASLAAERGPDGYGVYIDGSVTKKLKAVPVINERAMVIIGHCRLHTVIGTSSDEAALHPFVKDDVVLVHNGSVPFPSEKFITDSDYLADALRLLDFAWLGNLLKESQNAVVAKKGDSFFIYSSGLPIYIQRSDSGIYFCSKQFGSATKLNGAIEI